MTIRPTPPLPETKRRTRGRPMLWLLTGLLISRCSRGSRSRSTGSTRKAPACFRSGRLVSLASRRAGDGRGSPYCEPYRHATDVAATQIGDWRLNAFAGLCYPRGRSCQRPVALVGARRTIFAFPLFELTYGTSQPSAQTLFCVVAAPCNPLPLFRTPPLSGNTVRG